MIPIVSSLHGADEIPPGHIPMEIESLEQQIQRLEQQIPGLSADEPERLEGVSAGKTESSEREFARQQIAEWRQEVAQLRARAEALGMQIPGAQSRAPQRPLAVESKRREAQFKRPGAGSEETPNEREFIYNQLLDVGSENDKEILIPQLLERAEEVGDEWLSRRREWVPVGQQEPGFFQSRAAKGAALLGAALGAKMLYSQARQWIKDRLKRILKEHGKRISDLTTAEKDLLISASYARFNPIGSFFFQEAVLDMPEGQELRQQLWPVLLHVYYGKRRVSRKQANALRRLYDEAKELMEID